MYRGQTLDIEIGLHKVEYALREGEGLAIHHETEEVQLTYLSDDQQVLPARSTEVGKASWWPA
jgi:hypothetical protein